MTVLSPNQYNTQQHTRAFFQPGGPGGQNDVLYGGADMSYINIEGATIPISGGITAQYEHDPNRIGSYRPVALMSTPPELPSYNVTFNERVGGIPRGLVPGCAYNVYEAVGRCKTPGDFLSGWENYVLIHPRGRVTSVDLGDRTKGDGTELLKSTFATTWEDIPYPVGVLPFAPQTDVLTGVKVVDIVYGKAAQCASDCGQNITGDEYIYAAVESIAGAPITVHYSVNKGVTWAIATITTSANDEDPVAIDIVGNYLVVVSKTAGGVNQGGYYYALIDQQTGIPGTFSKVTTGFTNSASKAPNDITVIGSTVYFPADGGLIYYTTDITAGVSILHNASATSGNLLRLEGYGQVLVAVGAAAGVIYSINKGVGWALSSAAPGAAAINGLGVINDKHWWVANASGALYETLNGGATWILKAFPGSGAGVCYDLVVVTPEVMYLAHATATPTAQILATWNGGKSWTNTAPRITSLPVFTRASRLAFPTAASLQTAVNTLAVAGISGGGVDGITFLASSPLV